MLPRNRIGRAWSNANDLHLPNEIGYDPLEDCNSSQLMDTRFPREPRPQITTRQPMKPRRLLSDALLCGAREVIVEHRGEDYRLRVTSNGKLILTK